MALTLESSLQPPLIKTHKAILNPVKLTMESHRDRVGGEASMDGRVSEPTLATG